MKKSNKRRGPHSLKGHDFSPQRHDSDDHNRVRVVNKKTIHSWKRRRPSLMCRTRASTVRASDARRQLMGCKRISRSVFNEANNGSPPKLNLPALRFMNTSPQFLNLSNTSSRPSRRPDPPSCSTSTCHYGNKSE